MPAPATRRSRLVSHPGRRALAPILREETHCDDPRATETIGIVAYVDDEPAGWCAVDVRSVYGRVRGSPVPWLGRDEDKDDESVWAIPCLVVRKGFRGQGLTYPLVAAAVEHARARGAAAIEGYPLLTGGRQVIWDEMSVGAVGPFLAAGFTRGVAPDEAARRHAARVVTERCDRRTAADQLDRTAQLSDPALLTATRRADLARRAARPRRQRRPLKALPQFGYCPVSKRRIPAARHPSTERTFA